MANNNRPKKPEMRDALVMTAQGPVKLYAATMSLEPADNVAGGWMVFFDETGMEVGRFVVGNTIGYCWPDLAAPRKP